MSVPVPVTIVFDGHCGMCTRIIEWILAHDRDHRISAVPCQAREDGARCGISRAQCESAVWAVTAEGERVSGGQAAVLVAAIVWHRPWLVKVGRWPGVRQLLAGGYRLVARNRGRMPGVMPWCESHPGECLP